MKEILKELDALSRERAKDVVKAKKNGKPVIEYSGTYIPEEIIRATGAETYLMCRGGEPEPPDAVLDNMLRFMNPLARSMAGFLELDLDPVTPICDLLVTQQIDCHVARVTELLEYKGVNLCKIGIPADWEKPIAFDYYVKSLREMVKMVEEVTGNKVDWDKAKENFAKTNKINALFRRLNDMRKRSNPPIGLNEIIHLHHYSFMVDNDIMIEKLEQLCDELENAPGMFSDDAPRLLMAGRALAIGDYTVPRLLENSGAVVVAEMFDEGIRVHEKDVELEGDILVNFAKNRYLDTLPNDLFQPAWMQRYEFMKDLIKEYKVDGVVWYQLAFDEIYDMECSCLAKWFENSDTTFFKLESSYEYSRESMGPLTTRIESFVESLKEGK